MEGLVAGPLPASDLADVVNVVGDRWNALRGARVFIAGGSGFWGTWMIESALAADAELSLGLKIDVLTRSAAGFRARAPHVALNPAVSLVEGDVRRFELPDGALTHVVHCASVSGEKIDDLELADSIVAGTRRMLDLAVARGARRFLCASSGAIYGRQSADVGHLTEEYAGAPDPAEPGNAYGQAKRMAEQLCSLYRASRGIETVVARGFAFAGPLLPTDSHFAIGNFLRDGLQGGPIRVAGDGRAVRSYLYASDLAIWLWTILVAGEAGRAWNVGSENAITIGDLARKVGAHFGAEVQVGTSAQPVPASRYVPSTARARRDLGLIERVDLDESIRRTAAWLTRR